MLWRSSVSYYLRRFTSGVHCGVDNIVSERPIQFARQTQPRTVNANISAPDRDIALIITWSFHTHLKITPQIPTSMIFCWDIWKKYDSGMDTIFF